MKHWTNWVRWHILIRSCATSQSCEYRETVSSAFQNVKSSAFCYLPPGSYYYSCHNSDRPGIKNWPSDDWTMHVRGLDIRLVGCRNQPLRENSGDEDERWTWVFFKCKNLRKRMMEKIQMAATVGKTTRWGMRELRSRSSVWTNGQSWMDIKPPEWGIEMRSEMILVQ